MRFSRIALLLIVAALVLAACLGSSGSSPFAPPAKAPPVYGDARLYGDIAAEVAAGGNYYEIATRLQRTHNYPVRPFFTVRPPLVAWANAWFGDLLWPGCVLLALTSLVWLHNLEQRSIGERMAALFFLLAAGLPVMLSPFRGMHELWGGLFATLALGLGATRLALVPAVLSALVRELNFPLLGLFALDRRNRIPALIAIALATASLFMHRAAVLAWTLPGDLPSQGWLGLRGPTGWVDDLSRDTVLQFLPQPLAAMLAFAPLLGWVELGRFRALAWFLGVMALVTIFARPDNTYWCVNALPGWFIGLAFVPAFLRGLTTRTASAPAGLGPTPKTDLSTP